jgi:beta-galactosidase
VHADVTERGSEPTVLQNTGYGFQFEVYDKLAGTLVGRSGISPFTPQVNKSVGAGAEAVIASPKLWSPESPDLYVVKAQIVTIVNKAPQPLDEYSTDMGIRTIQWKEGRCWLNNSPVTLKGLLWQEDHATYGSAMTYDALERDVALMKSLGANMLRFLYPPHPYMLNLCDRYGLFVLEDVPIADVPVEILARDYYQELATTYAREMVERDKRHVSVLAWGIGNEFETHAPTACEFVNDMRNVIKAIDRRNVYFGTRFVKDPCFEYVDLIALNSYGEDPRILREALRQCKAANPEKPIILTRYGRTVEPGNHNGYSDPLSMESQARYAMQVFNFVQEAKIAGGVLWSFNDWHTDRAALTTHSHDPYLNAMGIVSSSREKRTAFDVIRALFSGEKVQALPVGNYSSNAPMIFVVMGFVALISFAFVYNANRRFRDSVNRSLFRTYNFFADVRDQRLLTYGQSIFVAFVVSITWATMLASIFSHYRDNLLLDNLFSQFLSDDLKEWFILLVWSPLKFIVGITVLILAALVLLSVVVRLGSMLVRTHVTFYHSFSITIWATLPYILFIPVAMILFRLMEADLYTGPVFILMGLISIWVFIRLLKGVSIIYDVFPVKVYAVGLLIIIVMSAAVYGYLDYTKSTTAYLKYMMQTMRSSM